MGTSRLWARLTGDYASVDVLSGWRATFGDEFASVRPFLAETGASTDSLPCGYGREGCTRRVHRYDDEIAATCGASFSRCERVLVQAPDLALWRLDEERVLAALVSALALSAVRPVTLALDNRATWLGRRAVGGLDMRFYAVSVDDPALCAEVAAVDSDLGPGLCVVLALGGASAGTIGRAMRRGAHVVALPDAATVLDGGGLDVDLDAVYHEHRAKFLDFDPSIVLSRRKKLIIDYSGGRAWLHHQLVEFPSRAHLPFRLLLALARHAGALVTRRRLYPAMWENGSDTRTHEQYAKLIRPHRTALGKLASFPISPTPGDEDRGGWTLDLMPHEVELWSEPAPFQQPIQQRKSR
jgi:hypothetical protein